ncbi:M14 family metallocarboxypeptidase [Phocea massiliensis]|jgi:g-D-glutamyl-meso-diaminopimelate peptidase|uniref:Gamma-D-glutamyl-L-diamino acid endopeptidase 1 n=1 Tax=uncultured Anaerotruncus sp. TaxID=905011 RepID=A0A6N2V297_9FIRM|nr:M14 family metallocarboxypeptidase [Merdimmobilis hominis]MCD4836935.1 M14 family metallocarboxypeptidase [Merdimmobilis hominis]PWL61729.1 MAG: gamma-D-glutamyl-meso-diaminopimelate peptidase [Oscillospiraceae bacterium]
MFDGFYTTPPVYENIYRAVYDLKGRFDGLRAFPIGESARGRGIFALALGDLRGATLLVGGTHGSEWLTTLLLFRFCEDLLLAQEQGGVLGEIDITKALENHSLVIVPCLNPDGVQIALGKDQPPPKSAPGSPWQANGNGVDLNHNFDAGWELLHKMEEQEGYIGPGPTRYGGKRPHSEPETRAIAGFCLACDFRRVYAFHSQGEEIYYEYGADTPNRSRLMAEVLAASCGYKVCRPEKIASHGGFKDWFIHTMHRPGFTIEIGRGKNPLPIEELEPIYARLLEMLLLTMLL